MSEDSPLTPDEINTLHDMLKAMVETADATDLVLLRHLNPAQKCQLWAAVDPALRKAVHELADLRRQQRNDDR